MSHLHYLSNSDPVETAQEAFVEVLKIFKETLTRDPEKKRFADELLSSNLGDVLKAVVDAKDYYESRRTSNKISRCLVSFSKRVEYYGTVVDVLVQHHPEYVALVWGAMKLLFGAVIEHERTGTTIVAALSDIADALSGAQLALLLYPSAIMKQAVASLYAHIVRLLVRAWQYYNESRLSRAIHSITRPATLRWDDIVKMIQHDTKAIAGHAAASSQIEIREMHNNIKKTQSWLEENTTDSKFQTLTEMIAQLHEVVVYEKTLAASSRVEMITALSDMQLMQALSIISSQCSIDHKSVFQAIAQLHSRRPFPGIYLANGASIWTSPQLQAWNHSPASSAILVRSTVRERSQTRAFCTEVVEQLIRNGHAVLWILAASGQSYSFIEVLKSLVLQALSLDTLTNSSENRMTFQLRHVLSAHFEEDYLNILGEILQHFKQVYIVANSEALSQQTALHCRECLQTLSRVLCEKGAQTNLKIITTAYGPEAKSKAVTEDYAIAIRKLNRKKTKKRMRGRVEKQGGLLSSQSSTNTLLASE